MNPTEIDKVLRRVFHPTFEFALRRVWANAARFVYYTSAETAAQIVRNREIWMRNSMTMNDYAEITHGLNCVRTALASPAGHAFAEALNECLPSVGSAALQMFEDWVDGIRLETYLTCMSEHLATEDNLGRLSMWRAYGGHAGVAIVINAAAWLDEDILTDAGLFGSPVSYLDASGFCADLQQVAANIRANADTVRQAGQQVAENWAFWKLRQATICTKHPGFHEELEWRIFASPAMHECPLTSEQVVTVRGIPQKILKLSLRDAPDVGVLGLSAETLIDHLIIGPCDFPFVVAQAMESALVSANIPDARHKIRISTIPLRRA